MGFENIFPRESQTLDDRFRELDDMGIDYYGFHGFNADDEYNIVNDVINFSRKGLKFHQSILSPVYEGRSCRFRDAGFENIVAKAHYLVDGDNDIYEKAKEIAEKLEIPIGDKFHGDLCFICGIPKKRMKVDSENPNKRVFEYPSYVLILPHFKEMNGLYVK